MSHAPGPWHVSPRSKYLVRSKDYYICRVMKSKIDPSLNVAAEADAKLIATAPELLQALKSLIQSLPDDPDSYEDSALYRQIEDAVNKGKNIIIKATGENYA